MSKSRVCINCISKNESQFVDRFMDSVEGADLVLVGDTGSTDDTVEKLRARGAVVHPITVDPWRFDVARNMVIDLIPPEYDCLFSLDLDEVVQPADWRDRLLSVWEGHNRVYYPYAWSPDKRFMYDKIHSHEFRWVSPCHEVLEPVRPGIGIRGTNADIEVIHHPDPGKSRGFYGNLLKLAVEERPRDDRILHYYGRELYYKRQWAEALEILTRHAKLENVWAAERAASCRFAAECYTHLGKHAQADVLYQMGCAVCGNEREPHIAYAEYLQKTGNHEACCREVRAAQAITRRGHHYLEDEGAWGVKPFDLLSVSAWYAGEKEEALVAWNMARQLEPENVRIRNNGKFMGMSPRPVVKPKIAVVADGGNATSLMESAIEAWHGGDATRGKALWIKAKALDPGNELVRAANDYVASATSLMRQAIAAWWNNDAAGGRVLFEKAKAIDPDNGWVRMNAGWFCAIQHRVTSATLEDSRQKEGKYKDAKVSVLITSFSRPEGAVRASATALATAARRDLVEVLVATDVTDPLSARYAEMPELNCEVLQEHATRDKWNHLAEKAQGDILMLTCDDVVFESYGWDQMLRDVWPDDGIAVMFSDSQSGHEVCEFPVISRGMVDALSYAAYPGFKHAGLDGWWSDMGSKLDRLYYLGAVWRLRHDHYIRSDVHKREKRQQIPHVLSGDNAKAHAADTATLAKSMERI